MPKKFILAKAAVPSKLSIPLVLQKFPKNEHRLKQEKKHRSKKIVILVSL